MSQISTHLRVYTYIHTYIFLFYLQNVLYFNNKIKLKVFGVQDTEQAKPRFAYLKKNMGTLFYYLCRSNKLSYFTLP